MPNTFIATAAAITQAGGAIEFVNVDPSTCLMDPNRLEDHLKRRATPETVRPGVVLPVHLYGQCADMDAICDVARRHGLRVLEDAAQAHGSTYRGQPAGALGDAAAFSFYPGKNLGACGEGGAVTTNDPELARHVLLLRDHGRSDKYAHSIEGYNGRLDAIQAGILQLKLKHLPAWNQRRRHWAGIYDAGLARLSSLRLVRRRAYQESSHHLYVIRSSGREALQGYLREQGIATGVHYPIALHLQACYQRLGLAAGSFPHAEAACAEVLSLPMFPELRVEQVERVVAALRAFDARQAPAVKKAG